MRVDIQLAPDSDSGFPVVKVFPETDAETELLTLIDGMKGIVTELMVPHHHLHNE